jgi:hypothetical protein
VTHAEVEAALETKTDETPEGLQYVIIRGLHAIGFAQPSLESWTIVEAELEAFLWKRKGEA